MTVAAGLLRSSLALFDQHLVLPVWLSTGFKLSVVHTDHPFLQVKDRYQVEDQLACVPSACAMHQSVRCKGHCRRLVVLSGRTMQV